MIEVTTIDKRSFILLMIEPTAIDSARLYYYSRAAFILLLIELTTIDRALIYTTIDRARYY